MSEIVEAGPGPRPKGPFPWTTLLLAVAALVLLVALVLARPSLPVVPWLETTLSDLRTSLYSHRTYTHHPDVVVVMVGDNGGRAQPARSGIDRERLAELIDAIDKAGPRAIGLDMLFLRAGDPAKDLALQRTLLEAKSRIIMGAPDERSRVSVEQRGFHERFLAPIARPVGYLQLTVEPDGVVRYTPVPAVRTLHPDSFALLLARTMRPDARSSFGRLAWLQKMDNAGLLSLLVNIGGQPPFQVLKAEEVFEAARRGSQALLSRKIVLIGSSLPSDDRYRTPLTGWSSGDDSPSVLVHAQAVAQILDDRSVSEPRSETIRLWLLGIGCIAGLVGWYRRHRSPDVGMWALVVGGLIVIDFLTYWTFNLVLPVLWPLLAWLTGIVAGRQLGHLYDWELDHSRRRGWLTGY